ncbi:hypothetical protein [Flavobacterium sp. UBA7680]|uniref:hypothetical protein n=1 Tax=Flavobacterium sp. UBA7680 TaxID=1946559 RepID=UPI0025BB8E93|nr:hypothetical protein [Flavobacterium sp. UBA7680]
MPKIKINLFGEGLEIKKLLIPTHKLSDWKIYADEKRKSLQELLQDPFFFYDFREKDFETLEDIPSIQLNGMFINSKNSLEIWFGRHKVHKCNATALDNTQLLFSIYNINQKIIEIKHKGFYLLKKEKGLLESMEIDVTPNKIYLEDFQFQTLSINHQELLHKISFKGERLPLKKKDTVITYQSGFEIQ